MSERKLRQPAPGQPKPALTRLKELGPEERAAVMRILRANTYQAARKAVSVLVGFECGKGALSRFFCWEAKREAIRESKEISGQVHRFLREYRPEYTEEKVREVAGMYFMMRTLENLDSNEFVKLARVGILDKHHEIETQRLDLQMRKLAHAGVLPFQLRKDANEKRRDSLNSGIESDGEENKTQKGGSLTGDGRRLRTA
jgi:hypothetical protein